jgi:hypothetical protein
MHGAPPKGIAPARLFRLLLGTPRPHYPLTWRADAAPDIPLHVVALRGLDVEAALEAARAASPGGDHIERFTLEVVALSLHTPDGRAFRSVEEAGALPEDEGRALVAAVLGALAIVSPTFARSDSAAWGRALVEGARTGANINAALALGSCVEHGWGAVTPRPDIFFGLPIVDLTDGQLMAFHAAREVVKGLQHR